MIRNLVAGRHSWAIGLLAVTVAVTVLGCATPAPQTADLRTPAAPRLEWARRETTIRTAASSLPADELLIREHRFVSHSPELNLDGEDQILRLASELRGTEAKIVIESAGDRPILPAAHHPRPDESARLDLERRQYVVQKLLSLGIPDAAERVVVEQPGPNLPYVSTSAASTSEAVTVEAATVKAMKAAD